MKPKATKCSNHCTSSITHTVKLAVKMLRRRIGRKIEDVLGEDECGFRRRKGMRVAIGMLRIISEGTLGIDEKLCACFIDWQNAFDCVKWTKLMQTLKEAGIAWHKRRFISKLYRDQNVKVIIYQGETRSVKTGRGFRHRCHWAPIQCTLYREYLTVEAVEGLGGYKTGGQVLCAVKYADAIVLLAKKETVL
jgi:hypothetical protein